jgi:glycosyltransferase involved in cell wall biosynthesis
MAKRKILVYIADYRGCGYYRCFLPYFELQRQGLADVKITSFVDIEDIMRADVVVFQRQYHDPAMNALLTAKRFKKIVISENDDYLFAMPPWGINAQMFQKDSQNLQTLQRVYRQSDALTLSTRNLSAYHEADNELRFVLPNCVDETFIEDAQESQRPTLLYGAAGGHEVDVMAVQKQVTRIFNEFPDLVIVTIGRDYRLNLVGSISEERTIHHPSGFDSCLKRMEEFMNASLPEYENPKEWRMTWSYDGWDTGDNYILGVSGRNGNKVKVKYDGMHWEIPDYYEEIRKTGAWFGIAPLCVNAFNSSKSWLKVLEYAMSGIPSIASNFGQYEELVTGKDPYSASRDPSAFCMNGGEVGEPNTAYAWIKAMKMMIENRAMRQRMRRSAIEWAKSMSIQKNVRLWYAAIETTIEHAKQKIPA